MPAFYLLLSIVGLGFLVFIHELGHLIVARRNKMVVEVFSIGFGKPFKTWTIKGVKWQLCYLPFGGYVRIAGMEGKGIAMKKSLRLLDKRVHSHAKDLHRQKQQQTGRYASQLERHLRRRVFNGRRQRQILGPSRLLGRLYRLIHRRQCLTWSNRHRHNRPEYQRRERWLGHQHVLRPRRGLQRVPPLDPGRRHWRRWQWPHPRAPQVEP